MNTVKEPYLLGGIMIIAATIIGAGMLAIPIAGAGIWFYVSSIVLLISAWMMLTSGLFILEVNLQYPQSASFNTIVKDILGSKWSLLIGICIVFVLYTLIYAYITTGSALICDYLNFVTESSRVVITILFTLFFSLLVGISTKLVDRFSTVLMIALIIAFGLTISNVLPNISFKNIVNSQPADVMTFGYWQYLSIFLPVCLASFGFHGNVPSLVKYFQGDIRKVKYSLYFGILLALVVYFIWLLTIHGNIPRILFHGIQNSKQDEVVVMLNLLADVIQQKRTLFDEIIQVFSLLALTSSFLGVALGLFDYFLDFFQLPESFQGRLIAGMVTFLPPLIASILMPLGFTMAIGYVGFSAAIWAVIVPALLVRESRKKPHSRAIYQVAGGNISINIVIILGIINILALILVQCHYVRQF